MKLIHSITQFPEYTIRGKQTNRNLNQSARIISYINKKHFSTYLVFSNLHIMYDVIQQFPNGFFHNTAITACFNEHMNELKYRVNKIFKSQNFT